MERENKKEIVIAISGGFDPIHIGHVRLIKEAKALGDRLIIILNNDHWLKKKKGYSFISEYERKEIIEAIVGVDEVILTTHSENPDDMSVCAELAIIQPDIFVNGGDRYRDNIPEVEVCQKINCEIVFNCGEGGKVQSSSWLLEKFLSEKVMETS